MPRPEGQAEERYLELQIDGKQMLIVLIGVLALCAISYHFGKRVGRAEASSLAPGAAAGQSATALLPPEDAAQDMTFFDRVNEKEGPAVKRPAPAPPVLPASSGEDRQAAAPRSGSSPAAAAERAPARPAETPMVTARSSPSTAGGMEVQVASVATREAAEELVRRLTAKGYEPRLISPDGGRRTYRVRVGAFTSRASAESAMERLRRDGYKDAWIPSTGD
jgi:cell division septation protein DedD